MKPIKAWLQRGVNGFYITESLFNVNQSVTAEPVLIVEDKRRHAAKGQFGFTPAKGDIEMHPKDHPDLFTRDQNVRPNSVAALKSEAPRLSDREKRILSVASEEPLTDRQIMRALNFTDMNSVRPRINELIRGGFLIEGESVKCNQTGKMVRTVTKTNR